MGSAIIETALPTTVPAPVAPPRQAHWFRSPWVTRMAYGIYAPLAWLLILHFPRGVPSPDLDLSWRSALTYAASHGLQFGRDAIFTYGPLSYLGTGMYDSSLYTGSFIFQLLWKAFFVALFCWVGSRLPLGRRIIFLLVIVVAPALDSESMHLLCIGCAGLLLCAPARRHFCLGLCALAFLAPGTLIKNTFLIATLFMIGCVTLHWLLAGPKWRAWAPPLCFAYAFALSWTLAGQNLSNLPEYLCMSARIINGYPAMSFRAIPPVFWCAITMAGCCVLQLILLLARDHNKRAAAPAFLLLTGGLFLAWKLGFVRADHFHTTTFLIYTSLAAITAPLYFSARARSPSLHWICLILVMGLAVGALCGESTDGVLAVPGATVKRLRLNALILADPISEWRLLDRVMAAQSKNFALPKIRAAVGQDTVDVIGTDQSLAILNGLNYWQAPVVQGYSAYEPALAAANVDFYRSPERAPAYVIFKLDGIDSRLPSLDSAAVLLELWQRYDPVLVEHDHLLLRRKAAAVPSPRLTLRSEGDFSLAGELRLPAGGAYWCELEMKPTLLGVLQSFVYHEPEMYIEVQYAHRETAKWRIVPQIARCGFVVNPALENTADFLRWMAATPGGQPALTEEVRALRLVQRPGLAARLASPVHYKLYEIQPGAARDEPSRALAESLIPAASYGDLFTPPPVLARSIQPIDRFAYNHHPFLMLQAPGALWFDIPANATTLSAKFTVAPKAVSPNKTQGIEFRVDYIPAAGEGGAAAAATLYSRVLRPSTIPADAEIQQLDLALPPSAHGQLILRSLPGPTRQVDFAWTGWTDVHFK